MKAQVINLRRQPERYQQFLDLNARTQIEFERRDAIDGRDLKDGDPVALGFVAPGSKFTPGSVGNGASHLNIWKVVAGGSEPTMVFEDDAIIRDDISSTLPSVLAHVEDWDVVLLGYNTDSVLVVELNQGLRTATLFSPPYPDRAMEETFQISRSPVGLFKLHNCFGTCGYIISPSGARRLLDLCGTLDNRMIHVPALNSTFPSAGLDCSMNSVYKEISAYACFAPLVLPRNQRSMSTIQTADAKIWM